MVELSNERQQKLVSVYLCLKPPLKPEAEAGVCRESSTRILRTRRAFKRIFRERGEAGGASARMRGARPCASVTPCIFNDRPRGEATAKSSPVQCCQVRNLKIIGTLARGSCHRLPMKTSCSNNVSLSTFSLEHWRPSSRRRKLTEMMRWIKGAFRSQGRSSGKWVERGGWTR